MKAFKLYFDKDKETAWLNEKAAEGWAMTGFFAGLYSFERCEPGKYEYQIDICGRFGSVDEDYRSFMREAGIEIVQSWGYWVILRKEADGEPFELYTDVDSRIEHYTKILKMFRVVTILELICMFVELFAAVRTGDPVFFALFFLLFAIVVAFARINFHTQDMIATLNEQKSGIEEPRKRRPSLMLALGLLVNSIGLLTRDSLPPAIGLFITLAAIVLMLLGIAQTAADISRDR